MACFMRGEIPAQQSKSTSQPQDRVDLGSEAWWAPLANEWSLWALDPLLSRTF